MSETRTHYQLSFTARQALALFVGLLVALGLAYFLGVMTGFGKKDAAGTPVQIPVAAAQPTPTEETLPAEIAPTAVAASPTRTSPVPAFPKPVLGTEPTAARPIQFFEDRPESEPTAAPNRAVTSSSAALPGRAPVRPTAARSHSTPAAEGFLVQVLSVTSESEARARRDKLVHRGYNARVISGQSPRGTVYRVRVGPFSTRDAAQRAADQLSRDERTKAWIVPAGK